MNSVQRNQISTQEACWLHPLAAQLNAELGGS